MPEALSTTLPLTMAAVLIVSGIAKLRHPDELAGWSALGVPTVLRREWLRRLHPWGELALGVALGCLGGSFGLIAALAALSLMIAYLILVWRLLHRAEDASCACFGTRQQITRATVIRNAWLTVLAAATVGVIWLNPLVGGALAAGATEWAWVLGTVVAVATALLIVWPGTDTDGRAQGPDDVAPPASAVGDAEVDYIRTRTPAVPVTLGDGSIVNLRALATGKPILLLAVSETCGSCKSVIDNVDQWRIRLPEVDVRFLLRRPPGESALTAITEPKSLHDPERYVSSSIADWPTPTAVLLGIDGLLAGGPVSGSEAISAFIDDVYASLHSENFDISAKDAAPASSSTDAI